MSLHTGILEESIHSTFLEYTDREKIDIYPWDSFVPPGLDTQIPTFWNSIKNMSYGLIHRIYIRLLVVMIITIILILFNQFTGFIYPQVSTILHTLIGFALSLLLVFKTNSCYDRYKRGTLNWMTFFHASSTFVRVASECKIVSVKSGDHIVNIFHAFVVAVKHSLRESSKEMERKELSTILKKSTVSVLMEFLNRPLMLQKLLSNYLFKLLEEKELLVNHTTYLESLLAQIASAYVDCVCLVKTPIPIPYTVLIRHIIFFYCMTVPFLFTWEYISWYLIIIATGFMTFVLFGIEEIGHMLEQPFGLDATDLPLDKYAGLIRHDLQSIFELSGMSESDFTSFDEEIIQNNSAISRLKRNSIVNKEMEAK